MSDYTPIYVGTKVVGFVRKGVFYKSIRGSKHILRKPHPAIALDTKSLKRAQEAGAIRVQVTDKETKITYGATIEHIRSAGENIDRGCGPQIALVLEGWTITRSGGSFNSQLPLFGDGTR